MTHKPLHTGPIKLVRRHDWMVRLTEYLVDSVKEGIKCDWEFNHCGGWVAGAVEEMTGVDIFEPFKPFPITCPEEAYLAIKRAGYESMEQYVNIIMVEKPVIFAQRGDLVFVPADGEEFAGLGMSQAVGLADPPFFRALGVNGLGEGPILKASRCFAVGGKA
jgi:hypothetical protein